MKTYRNIPTALTIAITAMLAAPGFTNAEELELQGVLRDFKEAHPDMQYPNKSFGLRQGIVLSDLGADGKPQVDPTYNLSHAMIDSADSFNQWFRNVEDVNKSIPHTITLADDDGNGIFRYEASKHNNQSFFPLDGQLWGNEGNSHNYHFTYEIATKFTYIDPADRDYEMVFNFSGDDDVFVYINGKLVVDLGGVHSEVYGSVNVDDLAADLGLEVGETYDFHFFFAERHLTQSNFTIETTIQFLSPLYD